MAEYPINIISFHTNSADRTYYIPPHTHNFWQYYYVNSGQVEMTISEKKWQMTSGNSVLISPGMVRSPKCNGLPPQYMFVFFENVSLDLEGMCDKVLYATTEQQSQFQKLFNEVELPKDRNSPSLMAAAFITLIIEIRRLLQHKQSPSEEYYQEIISRVDTYMRSNLQLPLQRKDLAAIAHVSPPHLARIFQRILKVTPLERLTQLRIQHAQLLLAQSDQPITTISAEVGYESISHFSRMFRKYSGKSPRQFRKDFFNAI